jgi:hypothetical protein
MNLIRIDPVRRAALVTRGFQDAIDAHIEATARSRRYNSAVSLVSYVDDPNPEFDAEARVFRKWRSDVWVYAIAELTKIDNGERSEPETIESFIAELPVIQWS